MNDPTARLGATAARAMSSERAMRWLKQVDGTAYRNKQDCDKENEWVAMVRTPAVGVQAGKIILAFGESFEAATSAAEEEWQRIWQQISPLN